MAPSGKRQSLRSRAAKSSASTPTAAPSHPDSTHHSITKRDKRTLKHTALLSKVRASGITKKPLKRRRPSRKLKTDISSLADALPEVEDEDEDEWEGLSDGEDGERSVARRRNRARRRERGADGKIVMKSLRHRPGAMKRKAVMEELEKERFRKNLAVMTGTGGTVQSTNGQDSAMAEGGKDAQADRWAALRKFIGGTMETNKAFLAAK